MMECNNFAFVSNDIFLENEITVNGIFLLCVFVCVCVNKTDTDTLPLHDGVEKKKKTTDGM